MLQAGDGVFVITMNDPKRLNCMSLNMVQEAVFSLNHYALKPDQPCFQLPVSILEAGVLAAGHPVAPTCRIPTCPGR